MNLRDIADAQAESQIRAEQLIKRIASNNLPTEKLKAAFAQKPPKREDATHRKGERVLPS